jgi:hypothetical protein
MSMNDIPALVERPVMALVRRLGKLASRLRKSCAGTLWKGGTSAPPQRVPYFNK